MKRTTDLIGNTPLIEASRFLAAERIDDVRLLVKLEGYNLSGSVKDRIALSMIEAAEAAGQLTPGATIIEPTSGNTGIGLAAVGAAKGYKVILTMPDTMSMERRALLRGLGADLVLTPGEEGMRGSIAKARSLLESIEGSYMPMQFENPANPQVHEDVTGPELWAEGGPFDVFVSGIGTGGTITGVGRFLKKAGHRVHVVAVEPAESPVLSGGEPSPHKIQGIGAGFIPAVLDTSIYDEIVRVPSASAFTAAKTFMKAEGISIGISSGAALDACLQLIETGRWSGKTLVAILPDSGDRYLSGRLFKSDDEDE
ncbi:MAG TPA: cysteine synthase A [Fastidiosipila sp.]|jgi:cysteine synthase A|nr:cysteine synthase A [Fastidiosipila sp.]